MDSFHHLSPPLYGNFDSFFWDARLNRAIPYEGKDRMEEDTVYESVSDMSGLTSSTESVIDYSFSEDELIYEPQYTNIERKHVKRPSERDSGIISATSSHSSRYTRSLSRKDFERKRRSLSSSNVDEDDGKKRRDKRSSYSIQKRTRGNYASASFHHSRSSEETRRRQKSPVRREKPCCWDCFERSIEKERESKGYCIRKKYVTTITEESPYENIPASHSQVIENKSSFSSSKSTTISMRSSSSIESDSSNLHSRLCAVAFSDLRNSDSLFSIERIQSLQQKVEKLLILQSGLDLSSATSSKQFCRDTNHFAYLVERRLRAIEQFNSAQYRKVCVDLCSLLNAAHRKKNSKVDALKRGLQKAVRMVF